MSDADTLHIYRRTYRDFCRNAKRSGLAFLLSLEEAIRLFSSPCNYCGQIDIRTRDNKLANCNGIDRVDNRKGYTPENVVSSCRICNRAKSNLPEQEYRLWIDQVVHFRIKQELDIARLKSIK